MSLKVKKIFSFVLSLLSSNPCINDVNNPGKHNTNSSGLKHKKHP